MRNPFAGNKQLVNGLTPPPPLRQGMQSQMIPRAPQLPMTLPEQLHPTTHALAQLDAALQENRRLMGHIEGMNTIVGDLRDQLREALRDRRMYHAYTTEIRAHLGHLSDAAIKAHKAAIAAGEHAAVLEEEPPPEPPQDLDAATAELEEQLRKVTAEVHASEAPPIAPTAEEQK